LCKPADGFCGFPQTRETAANTPAKERLYASYNYRRLHMRITIIALAAITTLAACDSDAERGLVGALAGAAVSDATGGSAATGAILGGAAGVFCDDAGVCK
jgi:hypothetical protein